MTEHARQAIQQVIDDLAHIRMDAAIRRVLDYDDMTDLLANTGFAAVLRDAIKEPQR
jgi:hypothetical protein